MTTKEKGIYAVILALVALGAYWLGNRSADSSVPNNGAASQVSSDKKVLYWYDPMVPNTHFDKPGKSPFMDMQLVPMYDEPDQTKGSVAIDSRTRQSLGIRTARVIQGSIGQTVETIGYVEPDQRKIAIVQTRIQGWVERLAVGAVNDKVRRGQVVMEVYSPDLMAAQAEYLLASRDAAQADGQMLAQAARVRLALLGMSEEQIRVLGSSRKINQRFAYYAPVNGIVSELNVRRGTQVSPGMNALSLIDLSTVWLIAEIPESHGAAVRTGSSAELTFAAYPGRKFSGTVEYIYPEVTQASRSLRVRIQLDNGAGLLRPGMYANVKFSGAAQARATVVPSEAVIATGRRKVVIVVGADGNFKPVDVRTGAESGGNTEILAGLSPGQTVVTSGQFLLDSESNMRSALGRLEAGDRDDIGRAQPSAGDIKADAFSARGVVKSVDAAAAKITVAHEPIAALKWPEMTMGFSVRDPKLLAKIKPGQQVVFEFEDAGNGNFLITALQPTLP